MTDKENKFELLIEESCEAIGLSYQAVKDKYVDYPMYLIEYIEKEVHRQSIEVHFEDLQATITFSFNADKNCNASYLSFDTVDDEESLIDYLVETTDFRFRKSSWEILKCLVRIEEVKSKVYFCFYKE
ncbi:MAG: hypothetical protein ACLVKO_02375 [Dysgonomonas sp.]